MAVIRSLIARRKAEAVRHQEAADEHRAAAEALRTVDMGPLAAALIRNREAAADREEERAAEQRAAADLLAAAWDGRGITNTPDGPVTTEEW
ncbi:hypothetical protein [Streptomyces sp. cmx-4-7]|uniref:hypothetical protein n=1 Tax=Streptomyces sp. cmx-4-7 TaxID=2790939 RepID=UPI00397EF09E